MSWDYTDFTDFYVCEGTGSLIGENGLNFTEQGVVAEVAGKFGTGRGTCDGNYGAGGRGFARTATGSGGWDTRVSQGFTKASFFGWGKFGGNTGAQEFCSQARSAAASNTKQWMFRAIFQDAWGAGLDAPVLHLWDHAANTFRVAAVPPRDSAGVMPTGVWIAFGWSVDVPNLIARAFCGVPGEGPYFDERAITSGWNVFEATALDIVMLGIGSGNSTEGVDGIIDHITWTKGRCYTERDFLNHWRGGAGLPRSQYRRGDDIPVHILNAQGRPIA